MAKIEKEKNPYCGCPVYVNENLSKENMIIVHKPGCSWGKDTGDNVRISVLDEKGEPIRTEKLW